MAETTDPDALRKLEQEMRWSLRNVAPIGSGETRLATTADGVRVKLWADRLAALRPPPAIHMPEQVYLPEAAARVLREHAWELIDGVQPPPADTEAPVDSTGAGRLLLNAYGRQCWELGHEAASADTEARRSRPVDLEDIDLSATKLDGTSAGMTSLRLCGPDEAGNLSISLWPGEGLEDVTFHLDDDSVDRLIAALRRRQVVIAEQRAARGC